ncbi:MAG: zf-HC2 domain-containing protein [Armatimonadetes bacterium]|nr:zf-HC2 domain-containing protein [Armatimonadota bacterium]
MSCNRVQSKLSAYLDGEMSGVEMLQVRHHVHECSECQAELESLRTVQTLLRDMPTTPEPPTLFVEQVQHKLVRPRLSYVSLALAVTIPIVCWAVFSSKQQSQEASRKRDESIREQIVRDQMMNSGPDTAFGGPIGHYTTFEGR